MMYSSFFDQAVRDRLDRKPFQPFIIELDDGERFEVVNPDALMYPTAGKTVFFRSDGTFDFVDCEAVKQVIELANANSRN